MALTQISTAGVKDDAVTAGKIPANAVGSSELADNAVDTAAIAADAVTGAKIADDAIDSEHITDSSIDNAHLSDNAVNTAEITDNAVTHAKYQDIPTSRLLGRTTSGTGNPETLDASTVRTFLNVADGATNSPTTTINNNADNRVITGSGTANTLEGESGLTYNGSSALTVSGSGQQDILIGSTNAGGASIAFDGDSNGDGAGSDYALIRHNTDGNLEITTRNPSGATDTIFKQGTTESLRIGSSGKVGIGMTPGTGTGYILQLDSGAAQTFMTFGNSGSGNGANNGLVVGNDTSRAYLTQRENQPIHIATNNVDRLVIDASGHFLPNADSTYNIGSNGVRFANGYFDTLYGDGSNLTGVSSDVVDDTSPQLGGNLASNGNNINIADSTDGSTNRITVGSGGDLQIYHDGNNSFFDASGTGSLNLYGDNVGILNKAKSEWKANFVSNGAVELYYDGAKKIETKSYGSHFAGYKSQGSFVGFHVMGTNQDHGYGTNHGSGITTYDVTYYSPIPMWSNKTIDHGDTYLSFPSYAGGNYLKFTAPVAGLYQLELIASVESHHGGDWCQMGWEVNTTSNDSSTNFMNNNRGVMAVNQRAGDDTEMGCHFSTTIWLDANDYAVLYQQSTAAVRWRGNQYYARGHLIS